MAQPEHDVGKLAKGKPASAPPHVGGSKLLLGEGTMVDVKCLCGHEPETY